MEQFASGMETELVDLSGETLASLGALGEREFARVTRHILAFVDNPPTLADASQGGDNCGSGT